MAVAAPTSDHAFPVEDEGFRGTSLTRDLYLTHWFFFTNHSYTGERRFFVRVGQWRKNFGGIRG